MLLLGIVLTAFMIGAIAALIDSWSDLRDEWTRSRDTESRKSAQRLLEDRKRTLANEAPLERADPRDYAFRGFDFYDTRQAALEALGCTMLGDFALDHAKWTRPGFRTFIRVLVTGDRQTVCNIVDATPHPIGLSALEKWYYYLGRVRRSNFRGMSLRTELEDGRFLITATDTAFTLEEVPPEIQRETLARDTTASALLERHRERVMNALAQFRTTPVPVATVDDLARSWTRHQRRMRAYREQIGFAFTKKEEQEIAAKSSRFNDDMRRRVFDAMRTLEDDERKQAS